MADGAIFHLDVSTVSRSQGRSSVAAAAYRAGQKLLDERTGLCHDYKRKQGVLETFIAAPDGCVRPERSPSYQMGNAHRDKIKNSNILKVLIKHVEGKQDMASLPLLEKAGCDCRLGGVFPIVMERVERGDSILGLINAKAGGD